MFSIQALLCPAGILGDSIPALTMLPFGELSPASSILPCAVLNGGVATSDTMGSWEHRGLLPDSRYSTSSPGCAGGGVWGRDLVRSLDTKDQRRGRTRISGSLDLVGDRKLTLLP